VDTTRNLTRAQLIEIRWQDSGEVETVDQGKSLTVQFNPASLKVTYTNQIQTNDQSTGSSIQYVGKGTSKLAVQLFFDVSGENADDTQDVRQITKKIADFMATTTEGEGDDTRYKVAGARFQWGSFSFDGIIESMDETLDLWSEDGYPLRSNVSINMGQPGIHFDLVSNPNATPPPNGAGGQAAGVTPMTPASQGTSLQGMVASAGLKADWKPVAMANGIENTRQLATGTLINLVPKRPSTPFS